MVNEWRRLCARKLGKGRKKNRADSPVDPIHPVTHRVKPDRIPRGEIVT